jgi:metal-dependent amidase/aminoacylase/carboxypeptidase family protein
MTVDNQTEDFISASIDNARSELRELAKQIHEHPELGFKEVYAHDYLTNYLEGKGFKVTRSAGRISTAFVATYDTGRPGPSIGICSEFDA